MAIATHRIIELRALDYDTTRHNRDSRSKSARTTQPRHTRRAGREFARIIRDLRPVVGAIHLRMLRTTRSDRAVFIAIPPTTTAPRLAR